MNAKFELQIFGFLLPVLAGINPSRYIIGIAIGIANEIEKHSSANVLDPDSDSDFDPEKNVQKVTTAYVNSIGFRV